ncbi:DUF6090 family protein [Winogradskyella sp. SYSU M77433]|uniref:DUF6090 family protein n=1 Tax=Winogradskyella sp. SYSU M77433 TaxID=3042722 RepID=UPI00247FEEBD|nr:DUF6090 family protein [Winogradskyella sp. SYSU M77433]MDH7914452.1 DUF6090 family protein [Winogradskyella sp. SYSU M77433]
MIKFFRNIRKKLLNEGKTSKYFKYAIGEIILVVIGILIALQINNWNEKRKQTELGYQYLTEMRYELQDDVVLLDFYINGLKKSIENHEAALKTKNINTLPLDSLYMLVSPQNLDFKVSELTYNKMTNLGISKLSNNDQLNTMVTNYYNKQVVNLKLSLSFLIEELKKYADYFQYQQDYFDWYPVDEYPSLINETQEEYYGLNRLGLIKFATSARGRNLIINDLESKQYALNHLEEFQAATVGLLNAVYNELKQQDPTTDPLPELPEEYNFKAIELPQDVLKQYVGRYELTQETFVMIKFENKKLLLSYYDKDGANIPNNEILPYETDKFYIKKYFQRVYFNRDEGNIKSLAFDQNGVREFKKID